MKGPTFQSPEGFEKEMAIFFARLKSRTLKKIWKLGGRWRPIATAPVNERKPIWLKVPGREPGAAYSDTFWLSGFSVECRPTHWKPRIESANT